MCNTIIRPAQQIYTWSEVGEHKSAESCWIVIGGLVYDVTTWLDKHPGGGNILLMSAGVDATDVFNAFHRPEIRRSYLKGYLIGRIADYKPTPLMTTFRQFAAEIENSDLMKTSFMYYFEKVMMYFLILSMSIYLILFHSDSFILGAVMPGILMAAFFQQIAFMGHDLGHMAVSHDRDFDSYMGLFLGNVFSGVSLGWWKATHNTHHVVTNSIHDDPDIQHLPFFAVHSAFVHSIYSTYHATVIQFNELSNWLVACQANMYYVIMAFARMNLYLQSYRFLLTSSSHRNARVKTSASLELLGIILFGVWFSYLVMQIPHLSWRIMFVLLSHALAGILHVQITLSHFAMPALKLNPLAQYSFLEHQLMTSLDVDCPKWMDWFHGGLQFQVVHHLFPRAPRHNLREIRSRLLRLTEAHGLTYHSLPFLEANRFVLRHLSQASDECRKEYLSQMINMIG